MVTLGTTEARSRYSSRTHGQVNQRQGGGRLELQRSEAATGDVSWAWRRRGGRNSSGSGEVEDTSAVWAGGRLAKRRQGCVHVAGGQRRGRGTRCSRRGKWRWGGGVRRRRWGT